MRRGRRIPTRLRVVLSVRLTGLLVAGFFFGTAGSALAAAGTVLGQVYTAEHPDSTAREAQITLIFRDAGGELQRVSAVTGSDGSFAFEGLPADPEISYVVRVEHRGNDFLGSPIGFRAGEDRLEFNVLVTPGHPLPMEGDLLFEHPPIPNTRFGSPVPLRPGLTLLLTLAVVALFAAPVVLLSRRDRRRMRNRRLAPARGLILEAALLDERFAAGLVPEEEYRSSRRDLLERIREATSASDVGSSGRRIGFDAAPATAPARARRPIGAERAEHGG